MEAASALEDIDDDLDGLDVLFVKNNQPAVAGDYGIEALPAVVVFEKGVPNLYEGQDFLLTKPTGLTISLLSKVLCALK